MEGSVGDGKPGMDADDESAEASRGGSASTSSSLSAPPRPAVAGDAPASPGCLPQSTGVVLKPYAFDVFPSDTRPVGVSLLVGRPSLLTQLTRLLLDSYEKCNPGHRFKFKVFRRVLTNPKEGVANDGLDNTDANLICSVGDRLMGSRGPFSIVDLLGEGTFGQVFKCQSPEHVSVAVKVVKNKPSYFRQAQLEVAVLRLLNDKHDPTDCKHIVRLLDHFTYKGHLCLVFELLDMNLYELLKQNQFRGLPLSLIKQFVTQILKALEVLEEAGIIHCDLKPENILMVGGVAKVKTPTSCSSSAFVSDKKQPPVNQVKVIDFGSACFEGRTMYTYIQSRFYRSPEVLLGLFYDTGIDMWSLGCICAEMFLGLPIFPGVSEHNQLARIVEMLGPPPDFMLEHGANTAKYFRKKVLSASSKAGPSGTANLNSVTSIVRPHADGGDDDLGDPALAAPHPRKPVTSATTSNKGEGTWVLKTAEEYAADTKTPVVNSKKYFKHRRLQDIIRSYPYSRKLSVEETEREEAERRSFLGFILGMLQLNPWRRWTARQAAEHPFIEGGPPGRADRFEPTDSLAVRDRRLMSMMTAMTKNAHTSDASLDPYLTTAAYSVGRPPPSLLARSSSPIAIQQPLSSKDASSGSGSHPLRLAQSPHVNQPHTPSKGHFHGLHAPHLYAEQNADSGLVRSAPLRIAAQRSNNSSSGSTAYRRSSMSATQGTPSEHSSGIPIHGAFEGPGSATSTGGTHTRVRTAGTHNKSHTGGFPESYTYDGRTERMPTDFGYALQRPGMMMHFSPNPSAGGGFPHQHIQSPYGDGGYAMHQGIGSRVGPGTSPVTTGHMSRGSGGGGSGSGGWYPSKGSHGHMAAQPPPPPQFTSAYGDGPADDYGRVGNTSSPAGQGGGGSDGLESAIAEWDPFFMEMEGVGGEEGGGEGGGGMHREGSRAHTPQQSRSKPQGKPPQKDFFAQSPKQQPVPHNGVRGSAPGMQYGTPPKPHHFTHHRGSTGLSGCGGGGGGAKGHLGVQHHRHRTMFGSPQPTGGSLGGYMQQVYGSGGGGSMGGHGGSGSSSYMLGMGQPPPPPPPQSTGPASGYAYRHRSNSWHDTKPMSAPDSFSKPPPPPPSAYDHPNSGPYRGGRRGYVRRGSGSGGSHGGGYSQSGLATELQMGTSPSACGGDGGVGVGGGSRGHSHSHSVGANRGPDSYTEGPGEG